VLFSLRSTWFRICEFLCSRSNYTLWFVGIQLPSPCPFLYPPVVAFYHSQIVLVFSSSFLFLLCLRSLPFWILFDDLHNCGGLSKITPTTMTRMAICGSVTFGPPTMHVFLGRLINMVNDAKLLANSHDILTFACYTRLHIFLLYQV